MNGNDNLTRSFARWRWTARRASAPVDDAVAIFGYRTSPGASVIAGVVLAVVIGIAGAVLLAWGAAQ